MNPSILYQALSDMSPHMFSHPDTFGSVPPDPKLVEQGYPHTAQVFANEQASVKGSPWNDAGWRLDPFLASPWNQLGATMAPTSRWVPIHR